MKNLKRSQSKMGQVKDTIHYGWKTIRIDDNHKSIEEEAIATEFPFTIMVNGKEFATMVCSPTDLRELVIGFLASEGIIRFYQDIDAISIDDQQGFAYVEVNQVIESRIADTTKRFIGSCCGKSRQFYFKSDVQTAKTVMSDISMTSEQCLSLMDKLQQQSTYFKETGGVHNAALCTVDDLIVTRTDIGRHNTLDKLYGYILENRVPLQDKVIAFSGRISSEVILKISKIGVGILISKSAPTDLALRLAEDLNITTVGFVRRRKMNVYTHPHRITDII